jgi:hypothetical protein
MTIRVLKTTLTYALGLRLGGLGVFSVALALHVCLGSLSSILSSLRVEGPKQRAQSGLASSVWLGGFFLRYPFLRCLT